MNHAPVASESTPVPVEEISDRTILPADPVVSIRMITYNHAPYIADAIEGVAAQRCGFPIELVIGEDCSTDQTREICLASQRKYPHLIRLLVSGQNVGWRANGLRVRQRSRGKYVAWCEGDDYWHSPLKLQKQVDLLERRPDVGLVHCDADYLHVKTGARKRSVHQYTPRPSFDEGLFAQILLSQYFVVTCTAICRSTLLDKIRTTSSYQNRPSLPMGDTVLWLELSRLTSFGYIPESMATRRYLPESASQSDDPARRLRFELGQLRLRLYYMSAYPVSATLRRCVLRKHSGLLAMSAALAGKPELTMEVRAMLESAGHRPGWRDAALLRLGDSPRAATLARPVVGWIRTGARAGRFVRYLARRGGDVALGRHTCVSGEPQISGPPVVNT